MASGPEPKWTDEVLDEIIERICEGESLRSICRDDHMPSAGAVCQWLSRDEPHLVAFAKRYTVAREIQADQLFDEALEIADNGSNDWMERNDPNNEGYDFNGEYYQRSRLRVDVRKWAAGKLRPSRYGDRTTLVGDPKAPLTMEVSPSAKLAEYLDAKSR